MQDLDEKDTDRPGGLEVLIRTPSSTLLDSEDRGWHTGTPDIVWNTSYVVSVDARKGSSIVIALVDQHDGRYFNEYLNSIEKLGNALSLIT